MPAFALRPVTFEDEAFLLRLYADTRAEEMAAWGWDAAQQAAFVALQFRAQRAHYAAYPKTKDRIITQDGQAIGRLLIARLADELRLVDIALLMEQRGRGIGATLIRQVQDEARLAGLAVRLHVEKQNRAERLYERLGFVRVGETGAHFLLEWKEQDVPASQQGA